MSSYRRSTNSYSSQEGATAGSNNVVYFESKGSVEVAQDHMRVTLSTTLEGYAAQDVQIRLRQAVDAALAQAKPQEQAEKMAVRTGSFRISPRYAKDSNRIATWQGYAEVILEGIDFACITATAAAMVSLSVEGIRFGLAPRTQWEAEAQAQAEAIKSFQDRAKQVSMAFGFSGYGIREITISGNEYSGLYTESEPGMLMSGSMDGGSDTMPAEPGKTRVEVSIDGYIEMK